MMAGYLFSIEGGWAFTSRYLYSWIFQSYLLTVMMSMMGDDSLVEGGFFMLSRLHM